MSFISFFTLLGFSIANATPELTYLEEQNPQEYARVSSLTPIPTRAGHLRFVGSDLVDPKWAPLYLDRYTNGTEPTNVRNALLDLLYRTLGTLPEEVLSSYDEEPDQIRASIIEMTDFGVIVPEKVQKDPSALVRAAFVRQVAKSPEASKRFILHALQDEDPKVLADAARAAHQKECMEATPVLSSLALTDDHVVALRALYALSKLDHASARALVKKHNLTASPHKNLALFAKTL